MAGQVWCLCSLHEQSDLDYMLSSAASEFYPTYHTFIVHNEFHFTGSRKPLVLHVVAVFNVYRQPVWFKKKSWSASFWSAIWQIEYKPIQPHLQLQMLDLYKLDPELTAAVDKFDWYILPVLNADGYVYTWSDDKVFWK